MLLSKDAFVSILKRLRPFTIFLLPVLVIGWATYVNRFPQGYIFSGGDFSQPLNLQENFRRFFYVWNNRITAPAEGGFFSWFSATSFYFLDYYLPGRLGLNDTQILSFVFFSFFSLNYLSFLLATYIFFPGRDKVLRAMLSLNYSLNFTTLYFFTYSWGFSHIVLLYVFIPILTATFLSALIQKKLSYALLFIIFLLLSAPSYTNSAFAVGLALFLFLALLFFSLMGLIRWGFRQLGLLLLMVFGGLSVLSYWLLPTSVFVAEGLHSLSNGLFDLKGWLNAQSANVLSIFTGTPHYASYYPFHYENTLLSLFAFAPIFFFCLSLIKSKNDGDKKRTKFLFVFSLLFLIFSFLVKKTMPPFADLSLLVYRLPFLLTLRSYEKTAIFLPFIIFLAIFIFLRPLSGKKKFLASLILSLFLISARPFFLGGIQTKYGISIPLSKDYTSADYSLLVKIPYDYQKLSGVSNSNKTDTRIQSMPYGVLNSVLWVNYPKWKLIGSDPTEAFFHKNILFSNSSTFLQRDWNMPQFFLESFYSPEWYIKMLPYFGVSEVLYHKDVDPYFYRKTSPLMGQIQKGGYLTPLADSEMATLYGLKEENILPHFYIPERNIWLDGDIRGMANVVDFPDHKARSALYLSSDVSPQSQENLKDTVNQFYVQGELVRSLLKLSSSADNAPDEFVTPNTRFLPDSPFYFLIQWSENRQLGKQKDPISRTDLLLWLSSKRLTETERLLQEGKLELAQTNMTRYLETLKDLTSLLQEISLQQADSYRMVVKANVYLEHHEKILEGIKTEWNRPEFSDFYLESLGYFRKVSGLLLENGMAYYLAKISQPGSYEAYLRFKDKSVLIPSGNASNLVLSIDRQKKNESQHSLTIIQANLIGLSGKLDLEKGYHSVSFPIFRGENLVADGSFEDTRLYAPDELSSDSLDGRYSRKLLFPSYSGKSLEIPVKDYQPATNYRISFFYKTLSGEGINFSLWQDENDLTNLRTRQAKGEVVYPLDKSLGKRELWQYVELDFESAVSAKQAKLFFRQVNQNQIDINLIDNLRFEPVYEPDLILKQSVEKPSPKIPFLSFQKINPILYKVAVKDAVAPFRLVFSESFHPGWKLYLKNSPTVGNSHSTPTKSYFNGQIVEGPHSQSAFSWDLIRDTFFKPLAESRHSLVNGYANVWEIRPEDVSGQSEFTAYVEFTPQRLFYLGLIISVSVFLAAVFVLFFSWRRSPKSKL